MGVLSGVESRPAGVRPWETVGVCAYTCSRINLRPGGESEANAASTRSRSGLEFCWQAFPPPPPHPGSRSPCSIPAARPASHPAAAALAAGQDPCAAEELHSYDLPMHVAAVFILLGASLAGSLGPLVVRLSSRAAPVSICIRLGSYFGEQGREWLW